MKYCHIQASLKCPRENNLLSVLGKKTTNVISFTVFIGLQIVSGSDVTQQTSIFSLSKKKHRLSKLIYLLKDLRCENVSPLCKSRVKQKVGNIFHAFLMNCNSL